MKKILMVLADGFEEIEAVATRDVLKRLKCEVVLAGLTEKTVKSSAGLSIRADLLFSETRPLDFDALVLPGGLPGSVNLASDDRVLEALRAMHEAGRVVGAICAAPMALFRAGLTENIPVTGYPGSEKSSHGLAFTGRRCEISGGIVTAKGPGAAFDYACGIAAALGIPESEINKVMEAMFVLR